MLRERCGRLTNAGGKSPPIRAGPHLCLNAMNRQQGHRQVVNDRRNGLPHGERPDALRIERHYDGISGTHFRRLRAPEPAAALPGNDVAVGAYDIDSLAIVFLSGPAAPGNVFVTGETRQEYV